ncbi:AAC(3) family N-acetyltransferase [Jiangella ureilytica]|uniref:Aminoglycoside N(3)-acetyltransferase n=1 Tax=Jiangella ureilytica TaxID=2530374 RepID=A0A4R4RKY8_9ACTN|nr:AAC(3) family N-acetyltransferase [Jiangella ureilytica]TDC50321.1 AAC(3) family N-acetyltransferase [Jiangella ureilytica]
MTVAAEVGTADVRAAAERFGLVGRPVCLHSALSSFGRVAGGADAVVDGLLAAGCTVLVPSASAVFAAPPPAGHTPLPHNSEDDGSIPAAPPAAGYDAAGDTVDRAMGAIPRAVLARQGRSRGAHPLSSFAAVGPLAEPLVAGQSADDVFAPLRELAERGGAVVLAGVGLDALTLLHAAEEDAGLRLMVRWARVGDATGPVAVRHGGCSRGFERLAPAVAHLERAGVVGASRWRTYPAAELLAAAGAVFRRDRLAGVCHDPGCRRCAARIAETGGVIETR